MNKSPSLLEESKIQAAILLKSLRADNPIKANAAAQRFICLSKFAISPDLVFLKLHAKLKHALAVIADEQGFTSWISLKTYLLQVADYPAPDYVPGGFLNHWFTTYKQAKQHQQQYGGFLLPYKDQFFICTAEYIANMGLDPSDEDWRLIECDWVCPKQQQAWQRLYKKWVQAKEVSHG